MLTPSKLAIRLYEGASERVIYCLEVSCGKRKLPLSFPDYGPVKFYQDAGAFGWCRDLICVAEAMKSSAMWNINLDEFTVCHDLFIGRGELPAAWYKPLVAISAARKRLGMGQALDPVEVMNLLVKHDPDIRKYLAAKRVRIDSEDYTPLYTNSDELIIALQYCLLDPECAESYAAMASTYAPYMSHVNHEWVAKAISIVMQGVDSPRVLDLGCGEGSGTITMASTSPECTFVGIERQSMEMFAEVRTDLPPNVRFIDADFLTADWEDAQVCIAGAVVGHLSLKATKQLVAKVYTALPEGGYFFCCPQEDGDYGDYRGNVAIYQKSGKGFVTVNRNDLPYSL